MNPRLVSVSQILKVDDWLFTKGLEGLGADELDTRLEGRANSIRWIIGHLTGARYLMAQLAGSDEVFRHAGHFERGADHGDVATLPEAAEIVADWQQISAILHERVANLDDAALDRESDQKFPAGDNSILGGLSFLCLHESYHLGQLGLIRVALGHPATVS